MIIAFSSHSKGSGQRAGNYLIADVNPVTKVEREVAPEVVKGDMEATVRLIDSLQFKHTYSSGVLSFAPGQEVTPEMEQDIIGLFERAAFAGLEPDRYSIVWVRHEHAGHHELHFLTARVELSTAKSMNIRPPGERSKELFDDVRTLVNHKYGLASPDDPQRAQELALPNYLAKMQAHAKRMGEEVKEDLRQGIHKVIEKQISSGLIQSRDDVISTLKEAGFEVPRAGKNYITVSDGNNKIRMKGLCYERQFECTRSIEGKLRDATIGRERCPERSISKVSERLKRAVKARAKYNLERYQRKGELALERSRGEREHDLRENDRDLRQDRTMDTLERARAISDRDINVSSNLRQLMEPLEIHDERGERTDKRNHRERGENRLSEETREKRGGSFEGEVPKETLESALLREQGTEIRGDAQGIHGDGLVYRGGDSLRETQKLTGGGLYDRAREAVGRSLEALRAGAESARQVLRQTVKSFARATGRLNRALQHGDQVVGGIRVRLLTLEEEELERTKRKHKDYQRTLF